MTDEAGHEPQPDPREEKFVVDVGLLSEDQLDGLVDEYCTRYHGLNDTENPMAERERVKSAAPDQWVTVLTDAPTVGNP